ncbi:hypothetical protein GCM10017744_102640 [Streptomyces antimycoticus]|uniref:Uncharacterized protein n=1 Tax=Streptomyces antimycoticus TaxID=68175 RepID=A0A4D4KS72_9ACTN|nr:hypothetical protein [Streptomyces antimycoticus]GDY49298.1 hypothetical protein SANT12839_101800 [Streptomyces antimycoticus]
MSATTTTGPPTSKTTKPALSLIWLQAVVTTWAITGLVLFGAAWVLGLQATWWQRILLALPMAGLAFLDARGVAVVIEARAGLTRALADMNWAQIPLAVAGGAWLLGLMAPVGQRVTLAVVIALVAGLYRNAPHATAAGGAG